VTNEEVFERGETKKVAG